MIKKAKFLVLPADELANPLQAILANTEAALLLLSSSNPDIDKIKATLGDVVSEVRRMTQMNRSDNRAIAGGRFHYGGQSAGIR